MLQIEHLTKTYGNKKAVNNLSLHIAPKEIYRYLFTELYLLIWMLVLILFTIVLFLWLKKKGVLLFEKL